MERIFAFVLVCLLMFPISAGASESRFAPRPNKAHLIQWRNWGPEALEEARKKNRLIVLSLSAVWCHWCHVMDETTYSDDAVISFMNEHFIPIRVDADMRPDIDALYNQGGWPSTAILTPQGEVISGGNYIPPEEMLGRLRRVAELFAKDPGTIHDRIEELKAVRELRDIERDSSTAAPDKGVPDEIVEILKSSSDEKHGGFGQGQKFPSPDSIDFLLSLYAAKNKDAGIERIVTLTLDHMAQGELFDKIEGGFFRYATKPDWSIPHYEKMLDVNAGMIRNYADASLVLGKKEYLRVMRETIRYVQANLYDAASGAFFGSQDADEAYYQKQNRKELRPPAVDRTVYSDSSSLMISALISAYGATGEETYLAMAIKCGDFLLENLLTEKEGVFHYVRDKKPGLKGMLSDNALLGSALLDLYNATGKKKYLQRAKEIGQLIIGRYYDTAVKRFHSTIDSSLRKPVTAGVLSEMIDDLANYRALRFLGRLEYTGAYPRLKETRDAAAGTLAAGLRRYPPSAAAYGSAVLWLVGVPVEITILAEEEGARKYLAVINRLYIPQKVVRVLSLSENAEEIQKLKYPSRESVYLCSGKRCSAAISDAVRLTESLTKFMGQLQRN